MYDIPLCVVIECMWHRERERERERCVAVNVWHIVQIVECMGVCVMLDRQNVYFVMFVTLVCLCVSRCGCACVDVFVPKAILICCPV